MPRLNIFRNKEYSNMLRKYKIFVDGVETTSIENNSSTYIDIPEGQHTIVAKIDWASSQEITLDMQQDETKSISVRTGDLSRYMKTFPFFTFLLLLVLLRHNENLIYLGLISIPFFMITLYAFTIGRKKLLQIDMK